MRLIRLEVSKVETAAAAESARPPKSSKAASSKPAESAGPSTSIALARDLRQSLLLPLIFHLIAHLAHVDSGERIGRPSLSSDCYGFAGEVCVSGSGGKLNTA